MPDPDFSKLARQAQEAVRDLDEPFRSLAYSRILDELIRRASPHETQLRSAPIYPQTVSKAGGEYQSETPDAVSAFMSRSIDASRYSELLKGRGRLVEKCLAVLKMARDEFGIDGLTSGELYNILVKRFRAAGVRQQHITRDLGKSFEYVSIVDTEGRRKYILTGLGESRLTEAVGTQE